MHAYNILWLTNHVTMVDMYTMVVYHVKYTVYHGIPYTSIQYTMVDIKRPRIP